jgi:hypothetical protein
MMQTHASTADCFPSTHPVRQLTDASGAITYANAPPRFFIRAHFLQEDWSICIRSGFEASLME